MLITEMQSSLLVKLTPQIYEKFKIDIGYHHVYLGIIGAKSKTPDFWVIDCSTELDSEIHCIHSSDLPLILPHNNVSSALSDTALEHDFKVEELLQKVNNALLDGVLYFEPGITRIVDDIEYSVSMISSYTKNDPFFEVIINNNNPHIVKYKDVIYLSNIDPKYKIVKNIIDEIMPVELSAVKHHSNNNNNDDNKLLKNIIDKVLPIMDNLYYLL